MTFENATLVFRFTHPDQVVRDLESALPIATRLADQLGRAAPSTLWRSRQEAEPVPTSRLAELVIPLGTAGPAPWYSWGIVAGEPPRDLYLRMYVGRDGVGTAGKASLRFERREQFGALEQAYHELSQDRTVDRLALSVGVDFHLRQAQRDEQHRPLPSLGWKNTLRWPADDAFLPALPDWVVVARTDTHLDLVLGPSPYDLDLERVISLRNMLVSSGLLRPEP